MLAVLLNICFKRVKFKPALLVVSSNGILPIFKIWSEDQRLVLANCLRLRCLIQLITRVDYNLLVFFLFWLLRVTVLGFFFYFVFDVLVALVLGVAPCEPVLTLKWIFSALRRWLARLASTKHEGNSRSTYIFRAVWRLMDWGGVLTRSRKRKRSRWVIYLISIFLNYIEQLRLNPSFNFSVF